jgi:SagB-type dehydrogenase family enzyme
MTDGDVARLYHRLSSYTFMPGEGLPPPIPHELIVQDFQSMEPERLPPLWKSYAPGLPVVDLPRAWRSPVMSGADALAARPASTTAPLDLAGLAHVLHLSAGVTRIRPRTATRRPWTFRAAGSAGGLCPFEVYVAAHGIDGLPDGVWWYEPQRHALVHVGPAPAGDATALVVTGIPWPTGWKYSERGFRHVYWDTGSLLAQTLLVAESAGWAPRLWTRFSDRAVASLVGADGVQEWPVAVVALEDGEPAIHAAGDAARGSVGDEPLEFPLVTRAQHAGDQAGLGDPWPTSPTLAGPIPASDDVDTVLLSRGSARRMDPSASISREAFDFVLGSGLRGAPIEHVVAVHAVEGVEPGLYRWPDMDRPVRAGSLREELLSVCWDQDLGKDAAFAVVGVVDLDAIDDIDYREAQLASGIAEGRLHLAAYALGLGASGMTFLDDELEALIAPIYPGRSMGGLLITCVGVPDYRSKPGGMPGNPTPIVTPDERQTPRQDPPRS